MMTEQLATISGSMLQIDKRSVSSGPATNHEAPALQIGTLSTQTDSPVCPHHLQRGFLYLH